MSDSRELERDIEDFSVVEKLKFNDKSIKEEDYAPWNNSYSGAVQIAAFSVLAIYISIPLSLVFGGAIYFMVITGATMVVSMAMFSKGMSREFGKSLELKWVNKARKAFAGSGLEVGKSTMTKVGDIDLLVNCSNDVVINVEIKSWRSYGEDPKFSKRERQGLSQIHSQRGALNAGASVLWLPQGKESFMKSMFSGVNKIDDETYLCIGDAKKLKRLIVKVSSKF